ncbi:MAG TPA: 4-hydroxy-tetrahydrodipicolinate reductase [Alphaproteobacteria bacterium]|jgi:4-hydroxy-tetrahydrodipicolinate reductase
MDPLKIGIVGAAGRMGAMLVQQVRSQPGECRLIGATERAGSAALGKDAGVLAGGEPLGVTVTEDAVALFAMADAVIDFTAPAATVAHAALAAQGKTIHVIGTTGLEAAHDAEIAKAARHTAIVRAANFSVGVNLLAGLSKRVASLLGDEFDIEIVEMHHRHKVDAPSGTALMLGEAAAQGRGVNLKDVEARGRDGITGARKSGDIGFASLRGGDVVGDHTVVFAADGERVELTHKASSRQIFARGAVRAAIWGRGKAPGLYSMQDVLGFSE